VFFAFRPRCKHVPHQAAFQRVSIDVGLVLTDNRMVEVPTMLAQLTACSGSMSALVESDLGLFHSISRDAFTGVNMPLAPSGVSAGSLCQVQKSTGVKPDRPLEVALHFVPFHFVPGQFVSFILSPHTLCPQSFLPRSFRPLVISSPGHFIP
jgi:hypothetical protein